MVDVLITTATAAVVVLAWEVRRVEAFSDAVSYVGNQFTQLV